MTLSGDGSGEAFGYQDSRDDWYLGVYWYWFHIRNNRLSALPAYNHYYDVCESW